MPVLSPSGQSNVSAIAPRFTGADPAAALSALAGDFVAAREARKAREREEAEKAAAAARRAELAPLVAAMLGEAPDPAGPLAAGASAMPAGGGPAAGPGGPGASGMAASELSGLAQVLASSDEALAQGLDRGLGRAFPARDVRNVGPDLVDVNSGEVVYRGERPPERFAQGGRIFEVRDGRAVDIGGVPAGESWDIVTGKDGALLRVSDQGRRVEEIRPGDRSLTMRQLGAELLQELIEEGELGPRKREALDIIMQANPLDRLLREQLPAAGAGPAAATPPPAPVGAQRVEELPAADQPLVRRAMDEGLDSISDRELETLSSEAVEFMNRPGVLPGTR